MEYPLLPKQMPERIQSVWRKTALLTTMAFILIGSAITGFLMWLDALEGFWFWLVIGYFGLVAIGLIISLALVPYRYHYYRFEVTPEDLAFQKGVPSAYEEFVSIRNRFKNFAVILYI